MNWSRRLFVYCFCGACLPKLFVLFVDNSFTFYPRYLGSTHRGMKIPNSHKHSLLTTNHKEPNKPTNTTEPEQQQHTYNIHYLSSSCFVCFFSLLFSCYFVCCCLVVLVFFFRLFSLFCSHVLAPVLSIYSHVCLFYLFARLYVHLLFLFVRLFFLLFFSVFPPFFSHLFPILVFWLRFLLALYRSCVTIPAPFYLHLELKGLLSLLLS